VFEAERPRIIGALLDAVVEGLRRLPATRLPKLPRMADFALWATACETALWAPGAFWSAYSGNRDEAVDAVIEADPVAEAVRAMIAAQTEWTGTASDLLDALGEMAGERVVKSKTWPDSPRALSGRLRRAATFLRKTGVEIGFEREGRARTRMIRIAVAPPALDGEGAGPSVPSAPSAALSASNPVNSLAMPMLRKVDDLTDGRDRSSTSTVRASPLKSVGQTDADGADANHALQSAPVRTSWRVRL